MYLPRFQEAKVIMGDVAPASMVMFDLREIEYVETLRRRATQSVYEWPARGSGTRNGDDKWKIHMS